MWVRVYSLICITTGYVIRLKTEYPKATTKPPKIFFGWTVTRIECQNKAPRKEATKNIISQNSTLI